jgi:hypothetical protein
MKYDVGRYQIPDTVLYVEEIVKEKKKERRRNLLLNQKSSYFYRIIAIRLKIIVSVGRSLENS